MKNDYRWPIYNDERDDEFLTLAKLLEKYHLKDDSLVGTSDHDLALMTIRKAEHLKDGQASKNIAYRRRVISTIRLYLDILEARTRVAERHNLQMNSLDGHPGENQ